MSKYQVLVGTYASKEEESLFLYEWDPDTGLFEKVNALKGLANPSYFVLNHRQDRIIAVQEEIPDGGISVIRFDQNHFEPVYEVSSYGSAPCFVSLNQEETELLAANYMSGSISLYQLSGNQAVLFQHEQMNRSGPNLRRQQSSHLHSGYFREERVFSCDLGGDTIDVFRKSPGEHIYVKDAQINMPAGSGPRHILFPNDHPDLFYVICELDGYLRTVRRTGSTYEIVRETDTLPPGTSQEIRNENRAGALKESTDGKWIFVTNRGADTVCMLKKDEEGLPEPVSMIPSGAEDPRDLEVLDHHLMIGHQKGKKITVLHYTDQGKLYDSGSMLDMPVSPVCLIKL